MRWKGREEEVMSWRKESAKETLTTEKWKLRRGDEMSALNGKYKL